MLYIVTRDRGGRDDVMRKSPIQRCEILNVCACVHEHARARVCACGIERKCVHSAEDAGSVEEKKKQSEGKNETKRNCHLER